MSVWNRKPALIPQGLISRRLYKNRTVTYGSASLFIFLFHSFYFLLCLWSKRNLFDWLHSGRFATTKIKTERTNPARIVVFRHHLPLHVPEARLTPTEFFSRKRDGLLRTRVSSSRDFSVCDPTT